LKLSFWLGFFDLFRRILPLDHFLCRVLRRSYSPMGNVFAL
jgi:hypothetical protein